MRMLLQCINVFFKIIIKGRFFAFLNITGFESHNNRNSWLYSSDNFVRNLILNYYFLHFDWFLTCYTITNLILWRVYSLSSALTNKIEQGSSWESDEGSLPCSQKPAIIIPNHVNAVHVFPHYFLKIYYNIIFPSTSGSGFTTKSSYHLSCMLHSLPLNYEGRCYSVWTSFLSFHLSYVKILSLLRFQTPSVCVFPLKWERPLLTPTHNNSYLVVASILRIQSIPIFFVNAVPMLPLLPNMWTLPQVPRIHSILLPVCKTIDIRTHIPTSTHTYIIRTQEPG
jgi:hypothetical protein